MVKKKCEECPDINKKILEHHNKCKDLWPKDRHDYIKDTLNREFDKVRGLFEKTNDRNDEQEKRIIEQEKQTALFLQENKSMHDKIDDLKQTMNEFIKDIKENYAKEKDVQELKDDNRWNKRYIIGLLVTFVVGLLTFIFNYFLTISLGKQ